MKSVFIFLLASTLYSQPLNLTTNNRIAGYYTVFNGVEINFNNESFTLIKDSVEISTKFTNGTKIFLASDNMQYFAIVNFGFGKDKSDYPIDIYTYSMYLDSISYNFIAPYDLPHPSINLNDNGEVFLFNPLNYQVTELTKEGKKEFSLEKSVEFEMERSFFSDINNGKYFLFISEKPLSPEEDADNVYLYTSDLSFQNI